MLESFSRRLLKNALFCLSLLGSVPLLAQNCPDHDILLRSQTDIDEFATTYPGCLVISKNLIIEEEVAGDIQSLSGLAQITAVTQSIEIRNNRTLTQLSGLEQLSTIGGNLLLLNNNSLQSLAGLSALERIQGSFRIANDAELRDLNGLQQLDTIGQDLSLVSNTALVNLSGLDSLSWIGGQFNILSNPALTSVNGLNQLREVGEVLQIYNNPMLQSLHALESLQAVGSDLIIDQNIQLSGLNGLSTLTSVGGFLQIVNNTQLTNIASLNQLREINGLLQVYNNPVLSNLHGLDSIRSLSIQDLALLSNPSLSVCDVKSICQYLVIPSSPYAISENLSGCSTRTQILASCDGNGLNSRPGQTNDILLFPNPTAGLVQIKGRAMNGARVVVIDSSGKKIYRTEVEEDGFQVHIIPAGFYTVHIWNERHSFYKPLIKLD